MPLEKSAGAVIFRKQDNKPYYLLLHYDVGHWDFSKGHIEKREKPEATAKREVQEETGLTNIKFTEGFKKWITYFFKYKGKLTFKIVTFYLVETKDSRVKISSEHIGYQWLTYQKALTQLTFKNAKEVLKKANDFLSKKGI